MAYITTNKNRLSVDSSHFVYLADRENFEIELFNPTQRRVLAKIKINGDYISAAGLILNPGQRVFLERFIDTNNRFVFETYEVDDTPPGRTATELNGMVQVEFYKEEVPQQNIYLPPIFIQPDWTYRPGGVVYGGGVTNEPYLNDRMYYTNQCDVSAMGQMSLSNDSLSINFCATPEPTKAIETGRVEKGGSTSQQFETGYGEFSAISSWTSWYKIKPRSTKPATAADLRVYCTSCGRKMKTAWKFCPSCGETIS